MSDFTLHNLDTCPEGSKPLLENSIKAMGMIPNLHAVMAESPSVLEGYQRLHALFTNSAFNDEELTVIWQTINVENECHYCVPAHTAIAGMMKVDPAITEALRNETPLADPKLETLRNMTLTMLRSKGHPSSEEINAFYAAGYTKQHLLEIILGIAQKTMSNYINHIAETPLDEPFKPMAWSK